MQSVTFQTGLPFSVCVTLSNQLLCHSWLQYSHCNLRIIKVYASLVCHEIMKHLAYNTCSINGSDTIKKLRKNLCFHLFQKKRGMYLARNKTQTWRGLLASRFRAWTLEPAGKAQTKLHTSYVTLGKSFHLSVPSVK